MVAPEAFLDIVLGEVGVGELHLPVGKQVKRRKGLFNVVIDRKSKKTKYLFFSKHTV